MANDAQTELEFMTQLCNEFKSFVEDAVKEGMHKQFEDHFTFMKRCLEVFTEMKEEE